MESYFEKFEVKPKGSTDEALQNWRKQCSVVKNHKRRFRFIITIIYLYWVLQEKPRIAVLVLKGLTPSDYVVPHEVQAAGFQICPDELGSIVEAHDLKKLNSHGGANMRQTIQEKLRVAVLVSKATSQFIKSLTPSDYVVPDEVQAAGFQICPDENTSRVFNSLGVPDADRPSLSAGTLLEVTGSLIEDTGSLIEVIGSLIKRINLQCNKVIRDNKGLLSLFETLSRTRERLHILRPALLQFQEEARSLAAGGDNIATGSYTETLRELSNFKGAGDLFTEEFFSLYSSVHGQQVQMFQRKRKLDKKLKKVRIYRKVSNFIITAAFTGIIICSVVAAALSAPHLLGALAALGASAPIASVRRYFNKLWRKNLYQLTRQRDAIDAMQKDLDDISVLVAQIESLIAYPFRAPGLGSAARGPDFEHLIRQGGI